MKQFFLLLVLVLGIRQTQAQVNADSTSFGIMIQATNTTMMAFNGKVYKRPDGNSYGKDATGYKSNVSFGVYYMMYYSDNQNVGLEFFYDKTTSGDFKFLEYSAVNFTTYLNTRLGKIHSNLYFDSGLGLGFIDPGEKKHSRDLKNFDVYLKLGFSFKAHKNFLFEIGGYPSVTETVERNLTRRRFYIGCKIGLDGII